MVSGFFATMQNMISAMTLRIPLFIARVPGLSASSNFGVGSQIKWI